jgi:glucose/arabinose dehydrogenase
MKRLLLGVGLSASILSTASFGAAPALPGLSQPLPAGPFTYRTGEGQDIRVTVMSRLAWPYAIAFLPDGDLLVTQRSGELKRIVRNSGEVVPVPGGPKALGPVTTAGVHGYMAIALHPRFADNGYVYIAYTKPQAQAPTQPQATQASQTAQPQAPPTRTVAVARARYANGSLHDTHDVWVGEGVGGPTTVALTPDAKLWIGTTEGGKAQDTTFLGGKILRLNDDGSVPPDNPFVGKQGWRPEIYTLGHRTALGLYVHPATGQLFEAEMGPNGGDEINLIKPGLNYGWPIVSLGRAYPGPWQAKSNEPLHSGYELPLVYWTPSISVTGLSFYLGDALPKWKGNLFVGGVRYGEIPGTGRVDRIVFNDKMEELRRESLLTDLHQRIRDVKPGPDGFLYVATDEEQGAILRIEPAR